MTRRKEAISKKKYYVYTLAYPEEMGGAIFYVGKGTGKRMLVHEIYAARSDDCFSHKEKWLPFDDQLGAHEES